MEELTAERTPEPVKNWAIAAPEWLRVQAPTDSMPELQLGRGESDAIALAKELGAGVLLIDERAGREAAEREGLTVRGTVAVIAMAADAGLLNLNDTLDRLERTTFRVSPAVLKRVRASYRPA